MTDNPTSIQAQKASLLADASLDHENKVGIENQINTDSGASLGASIKSVFGLGSTASEPVSTASINTTASSSGATSTAGVIPTGIDAIRAAGPQSHSQGNHSYSEPHHSSRQGPTS